MRTLGQHFSLLEFQRRLPCLLTLFLINAPQCRDRPCAKSMIIKDIDDDDDATTVVGGVDAKYT